MGCRMAVNESLLIEYIKTRFPQPVAVAWAGYDRAGDDLHSIKQLNRIMEILAQALNAFMLAEYLSGAPDDAVQGRLKEIQQATSPPMIGSRWTLTAKLIKATRDRAGVGFYSEASTFWFGDKPNGKSRHQKACRKYTTLRGEIEHELPNLGERLLREHHTQLRTWFFELLEGLTWLTHYRLIRLLEYARDTPKGRRAKVAIYAGAGQPETPLWVWPRNQWPAQVLDKAHCYIAHHQHGLLDASHLFHVVECEHGQERLVMWRTITSDGASDLVHGPTKTERTSGDLMLKPPSLMTLTENDLAEQRKARRFEGPLTGVLGERPTPPRDPRLPEGFVNPKPLDGDEGGHANILCAREARSSTPDGSPKYWAFKTLKEPKDPEEFADRKARLEREADLLEELDHDNIIRGHKAYDARNLPVLRMKLVASGSLRRLLDQGPVTAYRARLLARQILEALTYLHAPERRVIHRDIKPQNLLLDNDDRITLIDFGLARHMGREPTTRQGVKIGTPGWAASEQLLGMADPRCDIYSAGMTILAMLAQLPPGERESQLNEPDREVLLDASRPPNDSEEGDHARLWELAQTMVAGDMLQRPSAAEALAELRIRPKPMHLGLGSQGHSLALTSTTGHGTVLDTALDTWTADGAWARLFLTINGMADRRSPFQPGAQPLAKAGTPDRLECAWTSLRKRHLRAHWLEALYVAPFEALLDIGLPWDIESWKQDLGKDWDDVITDPLGEHMRLSDVLEQLAPTRTPHIDERTTLEQLANDLGQGELALPEAIEDAWDALMASSGSWLRYQRRAIRKRDGRVRWLQVPIEPLKNAQRRLVKALQPISMRDESVMAFTPFRSATLQARVHEGAMMAVVMDIQDFFGSTYPRHLADYLGGSERRSPRPGTPLSDWSQAGLTALRKLLFRYDPERGVTCLPQGAPSSPLLSNLAAERMDSQIRSEALQTFMGRTQWSYTRYADDLVLSTPRYAPSFHDDAESILSKAIATQGWRAATRKTRRWRWRGQRLVLCGSPLR